VVERGPEKAGVGGSIPSLVTTSFNSLHISRSALSFQFIPIGTEGFALLGSANVSSFLATVISD
jgi:hypothetical protein